MTLKRRWEVVSTILLLLVLVFCGGYLFYLHTLNSGLAAVLTPARIWPGGVVISGWDIKQGALLVHLGASVHTRGGNGETLLSAAVLEQEMGLVRELVARGADVNVRGYQGVTPIGCAAVVGNPDLVLFLLEHGADPNIPNSATGCTPVFYAVVELEASKSNSKRKNEMLKALLNAGADVGMVDDTGRTCLDWAADAGETKMCALLRQAGAVPGDRITRVGPFGAKK